MLTLTSLNGQEKGREFQLTGEKPELLGRQAPSIKLADAQTSRRHAEILLENNTWLIRDLESTNGTWVNGQKIMQITELEVGDRIVIGRHQFRVSAVSAPPAPSPKPMGAPTAPLIADEELGDMGVDLGESLSADILDDEALDLPELPESAISDEAQGSAGPAKEATERPSVPDDGVIDLDALLDEDPAEDHSHATSTPAQQESQAPEVSASSLEGEEQGVIDIDDLLADESTTPEADADSDALVADLPPAQDEADAEPPVESDASTPAPAASDDNVDFDLDELLDEELPEVQPALETGGDDLQAEHVADPEVPAEAPIDEITEAPHPQADVEGDQESDSIDDIDAMLEDLGKDTGSPDQEDVLGSMTPPVTVEPEDDVDDHAAETQPIDEASAIDDSDSLIDIDILAAATPAVPLSGAEPGPEDAPPSAPDTQSPEEPEEEPPSPDESGMFSDDSGIRDAADTGMDDVLASDLDDSLGGLHDTNQASGLGDAESADASENSELEETVDEAEGEPLASDLDDQAQLQESERKLLLTEQEQSKAVTGYKRSKLVSLSVVVLISAAIGFGGWYAFEQFSNRAGANQANKPPTEPVTQTADPVVDDTDRATTTPPEQDAETAPGINPPSPKIGIVGIPDIPAPAEPPTNDATADTTNEPVTEPAPIPDTLDPETLEPQAPSATGNAQAPDPFEDVNTSVFDSPPAEQPGIAEQPDDQTTDTTGTPTEQTIIEDINPSPVEPDATAPADPSSDEPAPVTDPTAVTPTTSTTDPGLEPGTSEAPAPAPSDPNQAQLNILAGVIDAQNKPGTGVNEQAAFEEARRIIYIVDASGSLVDSFPRVLNELNLSIYNLEENQAFTAIFFGADGVTEIPPNGLKWADRQTKRNASNWIDPDSGNVTAWGRGDLMQALQRATEYGADEIVVLSDNLIGSRPTQKKIDTLLDDIANLTDGKIEKINVVQFFSRDPKQVLKTIAERFNGTYSLIPAISEPSADHPGEDPLVYP